MNQLTDWAIESDSGTCHGYRITGWLADQHTGLQRLRIAQTAQHGRALLLDDHFMCVEADEFLYHESLVHPAGCLHPDPRRALVIGGGDGGSVRELCRYPTISHIDLVEIDGGVLSASARFMPAVHQGVLAGCDSRVHIHTMDGQAFVAKNTGPWDLIILDLTDPDPHSQPLYTAGWFQQCAARLTQEGKLTMQVGSAFDQWVHVREVFESLRTAFDEVAAYLAPIRHAGGWWVNACASKRRGDTSIASSELERRVNRLGALRLYTAAIHKSMFTLPPFVLDKLGGRSKR